MKISQILLIAMFGTTPLLAEKVGPWDLDALKNNVPAMKWLR